MESQANQNMLTYVVRKSLFFPVVSLFITQFVIIFLIISAKSFIEFIIRDFQLGWSITDTVNGVTIVLQFINIFITLYIVLDWMYSYYIFRPHEVIYRKGIFIDQRTDYRFDHIEKIDIKQGYIAKMLNYGTIVVYSGSLKEDVAFYDVPMPHRYSSIILKHAHNDFASKSKPYYVATS